MFQDNSDKEFIYPPEPGLSILSGWDVLPMCALQTHGRKKFLASLWGDKQNGQAWGLREVRKLNGASEQVSLFGIDFSHQV